MTAMSHVGVAPPPAIPRWLSRSLREISVTIGYAALLALLLIRQPAFFEGTGEQISQFRQTWVSAAPILVCAIGMTMVILARQIDISIGSQFSVCGVIAGLLLSRQAPAPVVLLGPILVGATMGAINGLLVAVMRLPSIVATLATMVIIRGILTWITQGAAVQWPASAQWLGASQQVGQLWIPCVALGVAIVTGIALGWMAGGRAVYAVGSDEEAARLAGVRPRLITFFVFMKMGSLTGLAAVLNAVRFVYIYPDAGRDLELQVIAAVVVGGTAISGGRGTLFGTIIGVMLLVTIGPTLIYFHAKSQWAKAIQGLIILLAVASDGLQRRRG